MPSCDKPFSRCVKPQQEEGLNFDAYRGYYCHELSDDSWALHPPCRPCLVTSQHCCLTVVVAKHI
eukprot:718951-Prorocentrum_lima.AAC.1